MKVTVAPKTTIWEIGEYAIQYDGWHSCYDVSIGNAHHLCVCDLAYAVHFILVKQGWLEDKPFEQQDEGAQEVVRQMVCRVKDQTLRFSCNPAALVVA